MGTTVLGQTIIAAYTRRVADYFVFAPRQNKQRPLAERGYQRIADTSVNADALAS